MSLPSPLLNMVRNVSGIVLLKNKQDFGFRVIPNKQLEMVEECQGKSV
jgi:hypothetical protein